MVKSLIKNKMLETFARAEEEWDPLKVGLWSVIGVLIITVVIVSVELDRRNESHVIT